MGSQLKETLCSVRCFLFDLDGTIFLGERLLPGAQELLRHLEQQGIPFFFLTNNSSRSADDYAIKLSHLGLYYEPDKIFTSGEATALYLKKRKPGARINVVGTQSLLDEFIRHGFVLDETAPEFAVLGFDTTLTYDKLSKFCSLIRSGLPYIATHPDVNCPTENGFIPDIGSFIALIAASTGREPDVIIGKPHQPIVEAITEKVGLQREDLVMIGDRLYTDIALSQAGIRTVLVFTGESQPQDIAASPFKPDATAANLLAIYEAIK